MKPFGVFALLARGVVWIVSACALTFLLAGDVTSRLDNALYDLHMRHWQYVPSDEVVIVAIDPKSLDALGSWPWPRSIHGQLINRLTDLGAGVIGMDVTIASPDTNHPENDRLLAQAIRHHGRVVMPLYADASESGGPLQEMLPIPEIALATASFGEVDVPADADGMTRGAYLQAGLGKPCWPLLALAVYQLDRPQPPARRDRQVKRGSPYVWLRDNYVLLRYAGPAGTFGTVSYVDVLNGKVDAGLLKGKTVLIGMTAQGIGDRFVTPGVRPDAPMPAVEYMANVVESLRRGLLIAPLGFSRSFLFSVIALAFPLLVYGWPGLRRLWVVVTASVAAALLASFLLLRLANIWWPPVSAIVIIVVGSIVWRMLAPKLRIGRGTATEDTSSQADYF